MSSAAPQGSAPSRKRSVFALLADIPTLVTDLVQREIELVKTELVAKLKALGVGAGLLVGAVIMLLGMLGVLLTAAILALSQIMPGWLAALLVAAVLFILAVILGAIGYRTLMRGVPPVPTEAIESIRRDFRAIKGIGQRGAS